MTSAEYKFVMSYPMEELAMPPREKAPKIPKRSKTGEHLHRQKYILATKALMLFFLLSLGTVFCYAQGAVMGYKVADLNKSIAALEVDNNTLQLQAAELESPQRIEMLATTKLGMVRPSEEMMVAVAPASHPIEVVSLRQPDSGKGSSWSHSFFQSLVALFSGKEKVGVVN